MLFCSEQINDDDDDDDEAGCRSVGPYSRSNISMVFGHSGHSQGRSYRGGRVPRAPYHAPLQQNDNRQFVFGADF